MVRVVIVQDQHRRRIAIGVQSAVVVVTIAAGTRTESAIVRRIATDRLIVLRRQQIPYRIISVVTEARVDVDLPGADPHEAGPVRADDSHGADRRVGFRDDPTLGNGLNVWVPASHVADSVVSAVNTTVYSSPPWWVEPITKSLLKPAGL